MKRVAWILTLTGLVRAIGCGGGAKVQPEAVEHERASRGGRRPATKTRHPSPTDAERPPRHHVGR